MPYTVGILGNTNIDLLMGPLPRLPAFGHEMVVPNMETRAAGAVGYTATALDRLGLPTVIVGAVGDDAWADFIRRELALYPNIDLSSLETAFDTPTGLSVALLDEQGQRGFVTCNGALDKQDAALLARQEARLLSSRYVLVCGYFFLPALRGEPMRAFLRRAHATGAVVMLDPGWALDDWAAATCQEVLSLLPDVDIFLPNLDEAQALVGNVDGRECARRLLERGAGAVALKLGPDGSLWAKGQDMIVQPGRPVKAIDTTGAGDSFNAALIYGMEHGWDMAHTLAFANAFCSVIVSRMKDRIPSIAETLALIG